MLCFSRVSVMNQRPYSVYLFIDPATGVKKKGVGVLDSIYQVCIFGPQPTPI